ncbi:glycosyltransferase [Vulcanisaeta moutnovskia]|nr:glycosyltransferase [Vulcanisaeta moutnovskia]
MPKILHSPIDVNRVMKYSSNKDLIASILARFEYAKDWDFILIVFKDLINKCGINNIKLYLIGSINNNTDIRHVKYLLNLAEKLGIKEKIRIFINLSIDDIYKILNKSMAFIHVKPHEHLGMVVIKAMAAGAVPIVHRSGGPWFDIVDMGRYGYGYSSREEAVEALCRVLTSDREFARMSRLVVKRAREFSFEKFRDRVKDIISGAL